MSDTPRTDTALEQVTTNGAMLHGGHMPLWVTARMLERELAEANRQATMRGGQLQTVLEWILDDAPPHNLWNAFLIDHPEAARWFNEEGVPK